MQKQIIIGGRYQIIRKIGEGGMAKVYLAYDTKLEGNVALKILRKENVIDKKVRNFKREALALSMLDDDNIVHVYDVGEEGNIHYIATEFVDGMTVKDYITSCSPIPVEEVIDIILQVLKGIAHAHEKGVIHKDIKSQNIMLDEDKKVKITDFGIANIMDDEYTKTQSLMGTPQYVAPEILNRDTLTEQSDIYSIGIMMYEMLVGTTPFTGEKPGIIMIKQMNHPLPSITVERGDVIQSVENVVIKATAKKTKNRYLNANEMMIDLIQVFDEKNKYAKKVVLIDDFINADSLEKTIELKSNLKFEEIKQESIKDLRNERRQKKIVSLLVIVVVLLGGLILFLSNTPEEMPDLIGKEKENAISELQIKGVDTNEIDFVYEVSDTIDAGKIISTEPKAGNQLTKNTKIIIKISSGFKEELMPNLEKKLSDVVVEKLKTAGYTVVVNFVDDIAQKGTIISQDPEVGTKVTKKNIITLEVSTGKFVLKMPNFLNLEKKAVEDWLAPYTIESQYIYECNDKLDKNKIFKTSPNYGEDIKNDGKMKIYISDGICEEAKKDPAPKDEVVIPPDPKDKDIVPTDG